MLENPRIFDDLVDSGLLDLTEALRMDQVIGATLTKTCIALTAITRDMVDKVND